MVGGDVLVVGGDVLVVGADVLVVLGLVLVESGRGRRRARRSGCGGRGARAGDVVVEFVRHSRLASAARVLAPRLRLACRGGVHRRMEVGTALLKFAAALVAAPARCARSGRTRSHPTRRRSTVAHSEPRAMRPIRSAERSTIQLAGDDSLVAIRPLGPTAERPMDGSSPRPLDERTLIDELWRISHFGWIPEVVIRRALTLDRGEEIPGDRLHQGLRQLLDRGWVEHRDGDANDGEHHWRLTDSGRNARVS